MDLRKLDQRGGQFRWPIASDVGTGFARALAVSLRIAPPGRKPR